MRGAGAGETSGRSFVGHEMRLRLIAAAAMMAGLIVAGAAPASAQGLFGNVFPKPFDFGNGPKSGYSGSPVPRQTVRY